MKQTPFTPIPILDKDKNIIIPLGACKLKMDVESAQAFIQRLKDCVSDANKP